MVNNLKWLHAKAQSKNKELTTLEFAKILFPDQKCETNHDKKALQNKINRYLNDDIVIMRLDLMQPIADILETDFNEMFGYKKKE